MVKQNISTEVIKNILACKLFMFDNCGHIWHIEVADKFQKVQVENILIIFEMQFYVIASFKSRGL